MPKISYTWRLRLYYAAGLAGTVALGLVAGTVSRLGDPGEYFWLVFAGLLVLAAGLFAFVYSWWRALDDVQKAGQMTSWYWGGTMGALVMVLYLIADRAQHSDFGQGAFMMFVAQALGALVIWVAWRVRGMGPTE